MIGNRKKIAICLSGQSRTWRTAKDNILNYFNFLDEKKGRKNDLYLKKIIYIYILGQYK